MKQTLHFIFILLFPFCVAYTQVSIGHNKPAASAALDVSAVAEDGVTVLPKGFLIPRMTTAERDAIVNPATGLIIYNSITNCTEFFQGAGKGWHNFCEKSGDGGYSSNGSAIVMGYDCQNGVPAAETGRMIADTKLLDNVSHTIIATVSSGGTYNLSAAVNGIVFASKGTFTDPDPADPTTKEQKVKLVATGTPLIKGTYAFNLNSVPDCSFNREVFDVTSGGTSVVGYWDCFGDDAGTLTAGRTIGSETTPVVVTKTISAIVDKIGTYSVIIPATNGVVFKAEGNFDSLGLTPVVLVASGIPLEIDAATKFDLPLKTPCSFTREILINSTSNGTAEVSTYAATTTTKGKLQFQKQIVDGEVSHTITATVVNPGKYTIATDTQNGATFKATGVFAAAGEQSVELFASGKPELVGDFEYTTDTTPPNCALKRATVGNDSSGGDAEISYFICSTNGAGPVQGVMMKGVEIVEGEVTQLIKVNVTKAGSYFIFTDTVNGVKFSGTGTFAATGTLQPIILTASGTPTESTVDPTGVAFTIETKPNCAFNRVILDKNSSGGTSTVTAYDCTGADTGDIIVSKRIDKATTNITKTIKVTVGTEGTYYIRAAKNGIVFSAQGTFVAADVTGAPIDVILKAAGKGDAIIANASFALDVVGSDPAVPLGCSFEREILLNPSSNGSADVATYVCTGDGTGGTGKIQAGTDIINETDTTSDKYVSQTVIADVNELGTYNISITNDKLAAPNDVDNKIVFEATGTFTKKGMQPLVLKAKPSATGQPPFYDLTKDANSDQPSFTIKPVATSGPEYTYCAFRRLIQNSTSGGSSKVGAFNCGTSTPFGKLVNGKQIPVAPAAGVVEHKISADVVVPGSYNLKSVMNGVTFRASGVFTSTGTSEVIFTATGIPVVDASTTPPYSKDITFKIHPFLPASAGCPTCTPPIPPRPTESGPDETVDFLCEFNRVVVEPVVITANPAEPLKVCAGQGTRTMTVTATGGGAPLSFIWQKNGADVSVGGAISVASTDYSSTITFTNPATTDSGDYTCVVSNGFAETSTPAKLTVNPLPTITSTPAPADTKKCGHGSFALRASSSDAVAGSEYKIKWYEEISGADSYLSTVNSGDAFTTNYISVGSSVVFKAEALNNTTGCVSAGKTAVQVQAYTLPATPTNTAEKLCGTGSITITPQVGTDPEVISKWYQNATITTERLEGGTVTFTTTGVQTVYLSAYHTVSNCESVRIPITVTANVVPTGVTLNTTTTLKSCGASTFSLTATAQGAGASAKVRWYINGSVESPDINSGAPYTTPTLALGTTGSKDYVYSVDAYDPDTQCATPVTLPKPTVTISVHQIPTISSALPKSFCFRKTVKVSATASNADKVYWYPATVGTPEDFFTDSAAEKDLTSLNLPVGVKTYYLEAYNTTTQCPSTTRVSLAITINASPDAPIAAKDLFARCGDGDITLEVNASGTKEAFWYDTATGTTSINSVASLTQPVTITSNKVYYVEFRDPDTGCISYPTNVRKAITAVKSAEPTAPTVTDNSNCGTGSVELIATATTPGSTINWYDVDTGGVALETNNVRYNTPSTSNATKSYYAEAVLAETGGVVGGCPSKLRTKATATIYDVPLTPVVSTQTPNVLCGSGTVTVSVATVTGVNMFWYESDGITEVTPIQARDSYTIASLNSSKTFMVEARNANCKSASKVSVVVNHGAKPSLPIVEAQSPATVCSKVAGDAITLKVTHVDGVDMHWFDGASEITPVGPRDTYTTPLISTSKTYSVEARDTTTGCKSSGKTTVTATIGDTPATPIPVAQSPLIVCKGFDRATVGVTHVDGVGMYWFEGTNEVLPSGARDTYQTDILTGNKTFTVEARNIATGCASVSKATVIATATDTPAVPVVSTQSPNYLCGSGTVTVSVATVSGVSMYWYESDGVTEVIPIQARDSYTIASLNSSKTFMVEARSGTCKSNKTSVTVKYSTKPNLPVAEAQSPATVCSKVAGDAITLKVTHVDGIDMHWFDGASEITPVGPRDTYTTPLISASKAYSVEARDTTTGCISSGKTTVTATIGDTPATPIPVAQSPLIVCKDFDRATVGVTHVDGVGMYWFEGTNEVLPSGARDTYQTDILTGNKTFTVEARNIATGCASVSKATVIATATDTPAVPVVSTQTPNVLCGSGTVTVSVATVAGVSMYWYESDGVTEVTPIQARDSYTIASLNSSKTFMVEARNANCKSASKVSVVVNHGAKPSLPIVEAQSPQYVCATATGGAVTLKVTHVDGVDMYWYDGATEVLPSAARDSYTTPNLTTSKAYTVEARDTATGCKSSSRTTVNATITNLPVAPIASTQTPNYICGSGSASVSIIPVVGIDMYWYDGATEILPSAARDSYVTPTLSGTKTYSVEARDRTTGCISATKGSVVVNYGNIPDLPVAVAQAPQYVCETVAGSSVTLKVNTVSGVGMYWYDGANEVSPSAARDSYATPLLTTSKSYSVEARNTTTGCISSGKTTVTATITALPATPVSTATQSPDYICGTGTATVSVVHVDGIDMFWYDGATEVLPSAARDSYTTPSLSASKTYSVEARNTTTGCKSALKGSVVVKHGTVPNVPVAIAQSPLTVCEAIGGSFITLGVTPVTGVGMFWYDGATEILPSAARDTYVTPSLTTSRTYSVEARNTTSGCASTSKASVTATIYPLPATPVESTQLPLYVCGTGTAKVTVNAVTGIDMYWYSDTGTPLTPTPSDEYTTPSISAETTYHVEARSSTCISTNRGVVKAKQAPKPAINSFPQSPVICYSRPFTQDFIVTNGNVVKYRTVGATSGGTENPLSWTVDSVTATIDWDWVGYNTTTQCESAPRRLTVTTKAAGATPTTPVHGRYCGGVFMNDPSASIVAGSTMDWYDSQAVSTGNLLLSNSNTYNPAMPTIGTNVTYYVEGKNTLTGCPSETRLAVAVKSYSKPTISFQENWTGCRNDSFAVHITTTNATNCSYSNTPTGTYATNGGTAPTLNMSYTTRTTYWKSFIDGCYSDMRTLTDTALERPTLAPTNPVITPAAGSTFVLTATPPSGLTLAWYNDPTAGTQLGTANSYTTPALTAVTSYYAAAVGTNGCPANTNRLQITVTP